MAHNEAMLLAAESELEEWLARAESQRKIDASPKLMEPMWDEVAKRAAIICKTPPSTLIAAAVKLRTVIHPDLGIEEEADSENMLALRQVLAFVNQRIVRRGRGRRSSTAVAGHLRKRLASTDLRRATGT